VSGSGLLSCLGDFGGRPALPFSRLVYRHHGVRARLMYRVADGQNALLAVKEVRLIPDCEANDLPLAWSIHDRQHPA
jgi:hypothetical protein